MKLASGETIARTAALASALVLAWLTYSCDRTVRRATSLATDPSFVADLAIRGVRSIASNVDSGGPPPTDAALMERLSRNRDAFERLVRMFTVDANVRKIRRDLRGPPLSLPPRRISEYQSILEGLDLLSVAADPLRDQVAIEMLVWVGGAWPDDGMYKWYYYCPLGLPARRESDLVNDLNAHLRTAHSGAWLYRRIDRNWYLSFLY